MDTHNPTGSSSNYNELYLYQHKQEVDEEDGVLPPPSLVSNTSTNQPPSLDSRVKSVSNERLTTGIPAATQQPHSHKVVSEHSPQGAEVKTKYVANPIQHPMVDGRNYGVLPEQRITPPPLYEVVVQKSPLPLSTAITGEEQIERAEKIVVQADLKEKALLRSPGEKEAYMLSTHKLTKIQAFHHLLHVKLEHAIASQKEKISDQLKSVSKFLETQLSETLKVLADVLKFHESQCNKILKRVNKNAKKNKSPAPLSEQEIADQHHALLVIADISSEIRKIINYTSNDTPKIPSTNLKKLIGKQESILKQLTSLTSFAQAVFTSAESHFNAAKQQLEEFRKTPPNHLSLAEYSNLEASLEYAEAKQNLSYILAYAALSGIEAAKSTQAVEPVPARMRIQTARLKILYCEARLHKLKNPSYENREKANRALHDWKAAMKEETALANKLT